MSEKQARVTANGITRNVLVRGPVPVAWVRGDADLIVSDTSLFDLAYPGQLGAVPGWPGAGAYTGIVYENCGHSRHVERPAEFAAALTRLLEVAP